LYEYRLRELGLFSLEKVAQGGFHQYVQMLKGGCKEDGDKLF